MAFFTITTYARATISETWLIEADSEGEAREAVDEGGLYQAGITFCGDIVVGDEEDREIVSIDPYDGELANSNAERMRVKDNSSALLEALKGSEAFISGFEDDFSQEGIADLLLRLRTVIRTVEEA